jgi:hypothetical protein
VHHPHQPPPQCTNSTLQRYSASLSAARAWLSASDAAGTMPANMV